VSHYLPTSITPLPLKITCPSSYVMQIVVMRSVGAKSTINMEKMTEHRRRRSRRELVSA
jgi:hypothetical protein